MKLSSACSHDLKMILFYRDHSRQFFLPELLPFVIVSVLSCLFPPLAVFSIAISLSPHVCFIFDLILISMILR